MEPLLCPIGPLLMRSHLSF
jgi:hypothetical protein